MDRKPAHRRLLLGIVAALALCLGARTAFPGELAAAPASQAQGTNICETLESSGIVADGTVWAAADSPFVVPDCDPRIANEASSLTIEAGVEVRFGDGRRLRVEGPLTMGDGVVFTSMQSSPAPGDWNGVEIEELPEGANVAIDGLTVRYAGDTTTNSGVIVRQSGLRIRDLTIESSGGRGLYVDRVSSLGLEGLSISESAGNAVEIREINNELTVVTMTMATLQDNAGAAVSANANIEVDASGTTASGNATNGILIDGSRISSELTWHGGDLPIVIQTPLTVNANLDVEPGTVIKMASDRANLRADEGTLTAVGSPEAPIIVTSITDDEACGSPSIDCDTNNDQSQTAPSAGEWQKIEILDASEGSRIEDAVVRYGGNGSEAMVIIGGAGATIRATSLSSSESSGLSIDEVGAALQDLLIFENEGNGIMIDAEEDVVEISGTRLGSNEGAAILINANAQLELDGNALEGEGIEAWSNGLNGILVEGETVQRPIRWEAGDLHWVIAEGDQIRIDTGGSLSVDAGAVVKMAGDSGIEVSRGMIEIGAAEGSRALITSLNDDACDAEVADGCDTNGDGSTTSPQAGNWNRIAVGQESGSSIQNCVIRYGGAQTDVSSMLVLEHDKDRVDSCEIGHSETTGVLAARSNAFYFSNNRIHDNRGNGIQLENVANGMTVFLEGNTIEDNDGAAIAMDANARIELDVVEGDGDPEPNQLENNGINGATVSGRATVSRIWKAGGIPFILTRDVDVQQQSVLTIEAGTIVKLDGAKLTASRGAIVAEGSEDNKVIFTSINDDSLGGRARPQRGAVDPKAGDWIGLELGCLSTAACSRLEGVELRYAGGRGGSLAPTVLVGDDDVVLDSLLIRDGAGPGILVDSVESTITNSTIRNMNDHAIVIEADEPISPELRDNRIEDNRGAVVRMDADVQLNIDGTEYSGNNLNGIAVAGSISRARSWQANQLVYVLIDSGVAVMSNGNLSVGPGTVIKADQGASLDVRRGGALSMRSAGEEALPIVLTSLRDDSACATAATADDPACDTNNDRQQVLAQPGDWGGLRYDSGASQLRMQGVHIRYAGRGDAAVIIRGPGAEILDSVISRSGSDGVAVTSTSARLVGNTFQDCVGNGLTLSGSWTGVSEVTGNRFTGNGRSVDFDGDGEATLSANVAVGNQNDAMLYCSSVSTAQLWVNDLVREIDCALDVEARLDISPGTVLQFTERAGMDLVGEIHARGVVFAGAGPDLGPGHWNGLQFDDTSPGGDLRHNLFLYAGQRSRGVINVETASPVDVLYNLFLRTEGSALTTDTGPNAATTFAGNIVQEVQGSDSTGIRVTNESDPVIERNRLAQMVNGIISQRESQPTIRHNSFSGISGFGVENEDREVCVSAPQNWWGHASGPRDESSDPREACSGLTDHILGQGIRVSDHVDYRGWIADAPPPVSPQLDTLSCGVTNQTNLAFQGATTPNAEVSFFEDDADTPLLTVDADGNGNFAAELTLGEGEHAISVESSIERSDGQQTIELRSPRSSYRHIIVDPSSRIDPAGIRFAYGPTNAQRLQPLRDVTGCATACGGPSSGRVTLPEGVPVRVRVPVSGNASSVIFSQPGQPDREMTSRIDYWETEPFEPAQGNFSLIVDGQSSSECFGFIYLGNAGRIFTDTGIPAEPAFLWDFEDQDRSDWISDANSWALTDVDAHSGRFSLTDSPGGNYGTDLDDSVTTLRAIDMRNIEAPRLTFWHRYRFADGDRGSVEVSTDNRSWTTLADFESTRDLWVNEGLSLEDYSDARTLWLRFRIETDRNERVDDGWYIDDIAIGPGGDDNGQFDPGEPVVTDASVTLLQRNPDTGAWRSWEGGPTGQVNPQTTDQSGTYGFYNLPAGEYRVEVSSRNLGVVVSDIIPVWDGSLSIDVPLTGRQPVFFPTLHKNAR